MTRTEVDQRAMGTRRRTVGIAAAAAVGLLWSVVAVTVGDDAGAAPGDCVPDPATTTTVVDESTSTTQPCEPVETPITEPPTTLPPTTVPVPPTEATTTTVQTPTTVVDPAATTTSVVDPAATTTTVLDPAATTTTVVDPAATSTTTTTTTTTITPTTTTSTTTPLAPDAAATEVTTETTTTLAAEGMPPPPSGPVVMPRGRIDTGELRSVTFPVAGPVRYANDWGACRDGCARSHQGNDIIGDRLQPILAMSDGIVDHFIDNHPTAGYGVAIIDADGWQYHVYHMNNDTPGTDDGADPGWWRFLPELVVGQEVQAGQVIGWMGDSGNSEYSVPHAHVEIHRPDGSPINPYWSLRLAQRDVNCASTDLAATREVTGPEWLTTGWLEAPIDPAWRQLELHGGDHGADLGEVDARMWIGPTGFHPVDGTAVLVGDPAYDENVDCTKLAEEALDIEAAIPTELATILATIRTLESGHDYSAQSRSSTASGAYQFIDGSWGGFGGYARAKDAPPAVQDAAAALHALGILQRTGGDVSMVPVYWYIGHQPTLEEWDVVPSVGANTLTPREYQARWLDVYGQLVGSQFVPASAPREWVPTMIYAACPTRRPVPVPGVEPTLVEPAAAQAFGPIPLPLPLPDEPLSAALVLPDAADAAECRFGPSPVVHVVPFPAPRGAPVAV